MNVEDKYYKLLDKVYQLSLAMDKLREARVHVEYSYDDVLLDGINLVIEDMDRSIKVYNSQINLLQEEICGWNIKHSN